VSLSSGAADAATNPDCDRAFTITVPTAQSSIFINVTDRSGALIMREIVLESSPPINITADINGAGVTVLAEGGTEPFVYSIDGGATQQASNTFTSLPDGSYTITVTDAAGCSATLDVVLSGAYELAKAIGLNVFPNPAHTMLNVAVDPSIAMREVRLVDAAGRRVLAKAANASKLEVDLGHLAPGVYVLEVVYDEGVAVRQVVVQ